MTPVERLQAAIDKLETLNSLSSQGPWVADTDARGDCVLWGERGKFLGNIQSDERSWPTREDREGKQAVFFDCDRNDALLMEALHRTIDAQLAILRHGLTVIESWQDENGPVGYEPETDGEYPPFMGMTYLALADAILGGDS